METVIIRNKNHRPDKRKEKGGRNVSAGIQERTCAVDSAWQQGEQGPIEGLTCSKSAYFIRLPVPSIQLYLHLDVGKPAFASILCPSKNQM